MVKKRFLVVAVCVLTTVALVFGNTLQAFACTGIYFGEETTTNGSVIWGRSEDISNRYGKLYTVHEAQTHAPGDMFVSSYGFTYPYPEQTLRYTLVADSYYNEQITPEPYAEAGMNEKNVAISGTVTLSSGNSAVTGNTGTDPMVSRQNGGLTECDLVSVVLMQATSARHAIEILADICDTYGSAERNGITVSDPTEVWSMQILSGHEYVAIKAPSNKVAFSPNITMVGEVDITNPQNVIASAGIIEKAVTAGTYVPGPNDDPTSPNAVNGHTTIMLAQSYAAASIANTVSGRMYLGYYYLQGVEAAKALTPQFFDYYIDPRAGEKYSLYEAMRFLAYHGNEDDEADGKYVAPVAGNSNAIGNQGTVEAHLFETRKNMPDALATIEWLALAPAEFSIYIPSYGALITETDEHFSSFDSPNSARDYNNAYWVFREIYAQVNANRDVLEPLVAPVLAAYQKSLIAQQPAVDEAMAALYAVDPARAQLMATALNKALCAQAYDFAFSLLGDINAWVEAGSPASTELSADTLALAEPDYGFAATGVGDTTALHEAVAQAASAVAAKNTGANAYASPKWDAFETAYGNAQAIIDDPDVTQDAIAAAQQALVDATAALKLDDTGYEFEGATSHTLGTSTSLVVAFARDIAFFSGTLSVNGTALAEGTDYTVEAGSTKVTIKAAYLETFAAGDYTLSAGFGNGTLTAPFSVLAASGTPATGDTATVLPPTGDTATPFLVLAALFLLCAASTFVLRRRTQN